MPDEPTRPPNLRPASRDDVLTALEYALRFDDRGKAHRRAAEVDPGSGTGA